MNQNNDDPRLTGVLQKLSNVKPDRPPTEQKPIVIEQMEKDAPAAAIKLHGQLVELSAQNSELLNKVWRWEEYDKAMMGSIIRSNRAHAEEVAELRKRWRIAVGTAALIFLVLLLIIWKLMS